MRPFAGRLQVLAMSVYLAKTLELTDFFGGSDLKNIASAGAAVKG
jgi:hypothetical protein